MDNLGILKAIVGVLSNVKNSEQKGQNLNNGENQSVSNTKSQGFNLAKLLESFKNFTQNNQNSKIESNPQKPNPKSDETNANFRQNQNGQLPNAVNKGANDLPPYLNPPLQSGMLSVMTDHDKFVKRVLEKNSCK